ncbi:MAG: isocitrate/isopropylmalate family dehydrogenase, partial [Acidobacteriota bacterium]|nr:isocitrate/isopropylmalate family dehydrogenase [Acidobacteriota bacterium]
MSALDPKERSPQRIALLPGDGIGRDVTAEVVKVLEVVAERWRLPLELVPFPWNADRYLATGETLPDGALEDLRDNFSAIFIGAYGDPRVPDMKHAADILLGIRFGLDLYVNYRPIKLYSDALCPLRGKTKDDVDFVVFRENTEGAYVGMGGNFKTGTADEVAVQEEVHSRRGVERIIRAAFEWAVAHGKSRVCMSDKSN